MMKSGTIPNRRYFFNVVSGSDAMFLTVRRQFSAPQLQRKFHTSSAPSKVE